MSRTGEIEWMALHRRLRGYRYQRAELDAAELFDLARAEWLRVYLLCGCATMFEYMERELGYAPHTARERLRVGRALATLPVTAAALSTGALTYTAVRELTRVATPETEGRWVATVTGKTVRQIEEAICGHVVGDLPEDPTHPDLRRRVVRFDLPPEVFALLRQARAALADELSAEVGDAELIETLCRRMLDPTGGSDGPAHQIAYKQCPDCRRATQNGAGRELEVSSEVFERAACDARDLGSLDAPDPDRATTTVTPRQREQVFARDCHRCKIPGCRSSRNLEVHHLVHQSHGGRHELWNLTLICSLCRARHNEHYAAYPIMPRRQSGPDDDGVFYAA